jgi:hypothetical protein
VKTITFTAFSKGSPDSGVTAGYDVFGDLRPSLVQGLVRLLLKRLGGLLVPAVVRHLQSVEVFQFSGRRLERKGAPLVLRFRDTLGKSFDLLEDGICCCCPDEGAGSSIVPPHELVYLGDQVVGPSEGPSPDGFLRDEAEPDPYLIEPGGIRWCIVNLIAGMSGQPAFDLGMPMGAIVAYDQVYV